MRWIYKSFRAIYTAEVSDTMVTILVCNVRRPLRTLPGFVGDSRRYRLMVTDLEGNLQSNIWKREDATALNVSNFTFHLQITKFMKEIFALLYRCGNPAHRQSSSPPSLRLQALRGSFLRQ
jgi:hypothetical protein